MHTHLVMAALLACASGCAQTGTSPVDAARGDVAADVAADVAPDALVDAAPPMCGAAPDASIPDRAALFEAASASGALAQPLLQHARRWLAEELTHIDPVSGLLMDPLDPGTRWSTQDTAADIYPYFGWASYLLAPEVFDGQARRVLDFERDHTTRPETGAIPYAFNTTTQTIVGRITDHLVLFGAAEYVKDGLTPIVELAGRGPWSDRMQAIELDSFRFGRWSPTPGVTLPWDDLEENGDHMQSLPRLVGMTLATGETRYLTYAEQIAEQYLGNGSYRPDSLRDHSCEMIGGFALLYAVEKQLRRPIAARYEALLGNMVRYIADYGLTPEGLMHNNVHPTVRGPLAAPAGTLSDNWGQNYVAFLIYADLAGRPEYAAMVDHALRSLWDPAVTDLSMQPFHDYNWQERNIDGLADSMEGAAYLLAYRRVPEGQMWLDAEAHLMDGMPWPPDKYGSNTTRTAILYARSKTLGAWVRPWRQDVAFGAAWPSPDARDAVALSLRADAAWSGRVTFDAPRYQQTMGFAQDYPRMNYLPAYFVADPSACYRVTLGARQEVVTGSSLVAGYPVTLGPGERVHLFVERL